MNRNEILEADHAFIMNTYGRLDLVPESGCGARITDKNGKTYVDFTSGIGVNIFGWNDESWKNAVKDQLDRFQHVCNYNYCDKAAEAAKAEAKKAQEAKAKAKAAKKAGKSLQHMKKGFGDFRSLFIISS